MSRKGYIILTLFILQFAAISMQAQSPYLPKLHPVSTPVYDELAPVLTGEGLIYTTNKPSDANTSITDAQGEYPTDIYISVKNENEKWSDGEIYSERLAFPQHDAVATLNLNEDLIFFSRTMEDLPPKGIRGFFTGRINTSNPNSGLFYSIREGEDWGEVYEFPHNDEMTIHPSLNLFGDELYFSSNREGGFGGYDLYKSQFINGEWSEPVNLGPVVNSSGDEIYPYIHSSGRLYFSTDGHDNRTGGFDIFYTDFFNNRWFPPVKMGTPFNSGLNDYTFFADENLESGFFTTNRRGTMDIFSFELTYPSFEYCKQQVVDNFCYIFYEENTVSLDSSLYMYEWNLGDGTKIRATEAEHCYEGPGDYLVQLNVVDKLTGLVAFNQAEYLVEVRKVIQPFITGPDTVEVNEEVQLHALESYLGEAEPGEYYWDFGDGQKETGATVRHTFLTPGEYKIRLGIIEETDNPETAERFCSYTTIVVEE